MIQMKSMTSCGNFAVTALLVRNPGSRLVVIFQETARNHFWEAGMLMQSYMLETVQ